MRDEPKKVSELDYGKDFLHPTFFNLHPTKFSNSENVFYFENENLELKIIHSEKVDS